MQDRELEDLLLDLKELQFLLKEAWTRRELLPVVERHTIRLIKNLEHLKDTLQASKDNAPVNETKIVATIEEEIVSPPVIEELTEPLEEQNQKDEVVEEPNVISPSTTVFGEQLKPAAELSKGLTLNDTFRFSRELFNGDNEEMNRILQEISQMNSYTDVVSYLSSQIEWDEEKDAVKDFAELLKKYFV